MLEDGRRYSHALSDHRHRHALGADDAEHPRRRHVQGPVLPHPLLAEGTGVDFAGKRVGIIGTGATAVQTIQEIAKTVGHLTVFQRTPNWCAPLHNGKIAKEEMRDIRARYHEIFALCQDTSGCYIHAPDPRATLEVTPEEREAFWEKLYGEPGFGIWMGNFRDMLTDREANALVSDFIARKIRQRVKDPVVAEKLIPKNHGFGTRRVPLETGYLRGLQPAQRRTGRHQRDADRAHHADRHQDQRRRVRIRHHHLRDRVRRDHRRLRPHRHPRRRRRAAEGHVERRAADLSRRPGRRLPEHADGDGPACRARQLHAHRRIQRRMGHRADPLRERARPDPDRGHRRGRRRMDRPRPGARARAC